LKKNKGGANACKYLSLERGESSQSAEAPYHGESAHWDSSTHKLEDTSQFTGMIIIFNFVLIGSWDGKEIMRIVAEIMRIVAIYVN
jgi:hypothetical protein